MFFNLYVRNGQISTIADLTVAPLWSDLSISSYEARSCPLIYLSGSVRDFLVQDWEETRTLAKGQARIEVGWVASIRKFA